MKPPIVCSRFSHPPAQYATVATANCTNTFIPPNSLDAPAAPGSTAADARSLGPPAASRPDSKKPILDARSNRLGQNHRKADATAVGWLEPIIYLERGDVLDPLDPFDLGWQRGLERIVDTGVGLGREIVDTGVGLGWGLGKALLGSEVGASLAKPLAAVPLTPAQLLQSVMLSIAEQFLDKRVSMAVNNDTATVTMTPTSLVTDVNSLDLARGQFASIQMTASDLVWESGGRQVRVDGLSVDCHDIRLRTSITPALVFGSIDVGVTMSARELRALVLEQQPDLTVDIGADGILRASWSRAQRLGHVVVDAAVDSAGRLVLTPTELRVASLSVGLRRWLRPRVIEVPPLPWRLRLVGLETGPGTLHLRGLSERAEGRISTVPVAELLTLVRAAVRIL